MEENKVTLKDIDLKNINWKTIKGLYLNLSLGNEKIEAENDYEKKYKD